MSQIRRVTRPVALPRSRRPNGTLPSAAACHDTTTARLATVTHLFPVRAAHEATKVSNIFADLEDEALENTPAARARARAKARMPDAGLPIVTNIFAEDCPDLSAEAEARMQARIAATPRKMALARAEITAAHAERAAARHPMSQVQLRELGGVAAGVAALLTMLHIFPVPHV